MNVLEGTVACVSTVKCTIVEDESPTVRLKELPADGIELSYFDLLDEKPVFSEAAILLEDGVIEYCYVKNGQDGKQYFGFDRCLPDSVEYGEIVVRHKLVNKMEANTYELYPSGKMVLSRRGKILEINVPKQGDVYV